MLRRRPMIEFLCRPEDSGVIAEPLPAKSVLPTWFRNLPGVDRSVLTATNNGLTVKRCMPFVDAMSAGWIIPIAATVRLEISEGGRTVTAGWELDRELVSNHGSFQIAGSARPWLQEEAALADDRLPHSQGLELPLRPTDQPAERRRRGAERAGRHRQLQVAGQLPVRCNR